MKLTALPHLSPDLTNIIPPTTKSLIRKKQKTPKRSEYMIICHFANFYYFTFFENIVLRILRIYKTMIKLITEKKTLSATPLQVEVFCSDEQSVLFTVMVYHSLE